MGRYIHRSNRAPFHGDTLVYVGNDRFSAQADDISESGMLFSLPGDARRAHFVRVQFQLGTKGVWIDADALWVRQEHLEDRILWAVRFLQLDQAALLEVAHFVDERQARQLQRASGENGSRRTLRGVCDLLDDLIDPLAK